MNIKEYLVKKLSSDIDTLLAKSDGSSPAEPDKNTNLVDVRQEQDTAEIGRKAIIHDPFYEQVQQNNIYKSKSTRISNRVLKEVSIRDWAVSAIIQARIDALLMQSRSAKERFDRGFKVVKSDNTPLMDDKERQEAAGLEDFLFNCGFLEGTPKNDRYTFGDFMKLIGRDALTFGHIAVEKVYTKLGKLHRFRPIPAEQTYLVDRNATKAQLERSGSAMQKLVEARRTDNDPTKAQEQNRAAIDYYKYVQMGYDGNPLAIFGDEDMIFKLYNPQNFADSCGYALGPVELAIVNITNHLNVEAYNVKFFTHGYAARGVLHLKGTVTQSALAAFRRQFHNSIAGVQHAWKTPIVAGLEGVEWVPLSGSAREMEYIAFNDHILRAICAQFQIDPVEIGLDYLSHPTGKSPMQQANNEYKMEASKERGFRPLLMFFEDFVNIEILPAIDAELAKKYRFTFVGYDDRTPMSEMTLMQAEQSVHLTMNDIQRRMGKRMLDDKIADFPLNPSFLALLEKIYTKGEIRERFFGDKGASARKELAYISGDPSYIHWNNLLIQTASQAQQMKMQQDQIAQEQAMQAAQGGAGPVENAQGRSQPGSF